LLLTSIVTNNICPETGCIAWLKIAFSGNLDYKEGKKYTVVIRFTWKK
jgi:hypothetical protein